MFLIVDASVLFSFFNPDSARRYIIESSIRLDFELISPEFAFEELAKDKDRIMEYSGIDELKFILFLSLLKKKIESVPKKEYSKFLPKAEEISPHAKDATYFALALSLNCPIWSDEKSFKKQSKVKVYTTSELLKELGKP